MSRYHVEAYDPGSGEWDYYGSVLLPSRCLERDAATGRGTVRPSRRDIEGALAGLGLWCPRGADRVEWRASAASPSVARVSAADGMPLVRLYEQVAASERSG